mgnify:CR=1 FL=1|jgi:hypothetical protein
MERASAGQTPMPILGLPGGFRQSLFLRLYALFSFCVQCRTLPFMHNYEGPSYVEEYF